MIVYVVLKGDSQDACAIAGVFLSRRLAERCAGRLKLKQHKALGHDYIDVQPHRVVGSDSAGAARFDAKKKRT